jgi:hypothetical protein
MPTNYTVVIERDDDGLLVASVPALPGCHTKLRPWIFCSNGFVKRSK